MKVIRKSKVSGKVISTEDFGKNEDSARRYTESQNKLKGEKMQQEWILQPNN